MNRLINISNNAINNVPTEFERYLSKEIPWNQKMIAISGARGSGKTILLLQQMKKITAKGKSALYVSLDDVYFTENKLNDIFNIEIKFGIGEHEMPMLKYASSLMNYAGTERFSVNELKKQFSMLGCNYDFYSDDSYVYANLEGIDKNYNNLHEALEVIMQHTKFAIEMICLDHRGISYDLTLCGHTKKYLFLTIAIIQHSSTLFTFFLVMEV